MTEANPRETTFGSKNREFRIIEYSKNRDSTVTVVYLYFNTYKLHDYNYKKIKNVEERKTKEHRLDFMVWSFLSRQVNFMAWKFSLLISRRESLHRSIFCITKFHARSESFLAQSEHGVNFLIQAVKIQIHAPWLWKKFTVFSEIHKTAFHVKGHVCQMFHRIWWIIWPDV